MVDSQVVSSTYTISAVAQVTAPIFTPASGNYSTSQNVTISCATPGATIRYTTDGTTPTANSPIYSQGISITSSKTIKAIGVKTGMADSTVTSASYTISSTYPSWVAGTAYALGDMVIYSGKTYKCTIAHTSLTGWEPPVVPALWQLQ
jgi:chitinase